MNIIHMTYKRKCIDINVSVGCGLHNDTKIGNIVIEKHILNKYWN